MIALGVCALLGLSACLPTEFSDAQLAEKAGGGGKVSTTQPSCQGPQDCVKHDDYTCYIAKCVDNLCLRGDPTNMTDCKRPGCASGCTCQWTSTTDGSQLKVCKH